MIVNDTKKIINQYEIFAKKMYGQNFLIDKNILDIIIEKSGVNTDIGVIEIGPGLGSLTEMLAINSKKVLSYEIDKDMVNILNETLKDYDNIVIKNIDILKADITEDINEYFTDVEEVIVVANLPYYITTPIIFKFLEETKLNKFLFMVQKEVGLRLTGKPNTKDYNALSVLMEYKTKSKIVHNVPRKCFYPEPNVESVLLLIESVKSDYGLNNEPKFLKFIQNIFNQRRKTMVNNISTSYSIDKTEISESLQKLGYNPSVRAEALLLNDIVEIYKTIFE